MTMSRSSQPVPPELIRLGILMHPAIAAASFAAVIQLASRESLSQSALLSVFCFAVAIPTSVAMVFISHLVVPEGVINDAGQVSNRRMPFLSYPVAVGEQLSFFGGVLVLFWSFHPGASVLFLMGSLVAIMVVHRVQRGR
jgi:hypothetical protein